MSAIKEFRILDLFCGAGGFSYGMHKNKHFTTVVALDLNEQAANTFKRNMPYVDVVIGDIKESSIRRRVLKVAKEKKVNMIIGGPPCQGFSLKGKKLGLKDPRNYLFYEYLKFVKELEPEIFVIENVKSLLTTADGWFKDEILDFIHKLDYYVDYGVLNAKKFGVPQTRERAIFICSKTRTVTLPEGNENIVTVRDAISDLEYLQSAQGDFEADYINEPMSDYQKMMRSCSDKLYNHIASNHSKLALEKLAMIPPEKGKEYLPDEFRGNQKFGTTWGRLIWDDISPTIDTRFDTPSNGTNSHPVLNRSITPREAARIQSFGDDFVFYGARRAISAQIGNAVPPLMAEVIANQIWGMYDG